MSPLPDIDFEAWNDPDASPIEDIRRAMQKVRDTPVGLNGPLYVGHSEHQWLLSQGVPAENLRPVSFGLDLGSKDSYSVTGSITTYWDDSLEYARLTTPGPVIGERRLPSPAAAQKAKAKRRAQKQARKR